jgi:hypothetical protein
MREKLKNEQMLKNRRILLVKWWINLQKQVKILTNLDKAWKEHKFLTLNKKAKFTVTYKLVK